MQDGLVVRDGTIMFGAREGLRRVSLHVRAGERLALVGPSGVGKTSLLRAIAGLDSLATGSVVVNGVDLTNVAAERRSIVYLHQSPSLFPHLSVQDNVGFPLEIRGAARRDARMRAGGLLERVHMSEFAHRAPSTLSGGQRHRVALARALAASPSVLLLDEPFAALDPALRSEVRSAVLALLADDHAPATILVTHDIDEAVSIAHSVAVLLDGTVAQHATPMALLSHPASLAVAKFLGLPNVLPAVSYGAGVVTSPLGTFASPLAAGSAVVVSRADAIRAQHVATHQVGLSANGLPQARIVAVHERVGGVVLRVCIDTYELSAVPFDGASFAPGDVVALHVDRARIHVLLNTT